ncbi:deaminase [Novymonas esmeraldas]|uniref:Deaminase n=1 Tax=Novymonas esmeraldas TaxID=1808958 RepID=A0AAW0EMM8_9TRYP
MSVHYVDAFMRVALEEAELALIEGEVPVGCVLVRIDANEKAYSAWTQHVADTTTTAAASSSSSLDISECVRSLVAARGRNQTNLQRHALAHAEFIAVAQLHSSSTAPPLSDLTDYILYVTVEPCVMCGAMLLYNRVAHVFFGCRNPRFGGNGTVLALHSQPPSQQPQLKSSSSSLSCDVSVMCSCSPHCNREEEEEAKQQPRCWPGYESEGGHAETDAVLLLQRFYERENPNAPGHKRRRKA